MSRQEQLRAAQSSQEPPEAASQEQPGSSHKQPGAASSSQEPGIRRGSGARRWRLPWPTFRVPGN